MAKYFVEDTSLTAIADAIRGKTGGADPLTLDQMPAEIASIQAGGGGGISAVKFIDVDITVEESTTTAVTYTVDGLELDTSVVNPPGYYAAFSPHECYVAFITRKEITGEESGNSPYKASMCVMQGNSSCTKTLLNTSGGGSGNIVTQQYGIYNVVLSCTSVADGKKIGYLQVSVRQMSTGNFHVATGTYNVRVYRLNDWSWGM